MATDNSSPFGVDEAVDHFVGHHGDMMSPSDSAYFVTLAVDDQRARTKKDNNDDRNGGDDNVMTACSPQRKRLFSRIDLIKESKYLPKHT